MQALWMEYERNSVKHHLTYKFITQNNDLLRPATMSFVKPDVLDAMTEFGA